MKDINIYYKKIKATQFCLLVLLIIPTASNLGHGSYLRNDSSFIRIGQSIPEISFDPVLNSPNKKFSTKELNGKPTILYFFSTACRSSFSHFIEIDRMYALYKRNFNLILVGIDLDDGIQDIYKKYSQKYDLHTPVTFDGIAYEQFNIRTVPNVIWINKNGVVQAITNVMDQGYLEQFINGKEFDFISYSLEGKAKLRNFNSNEPFLINGNGGETQDFIQRSLLAEWRIGMPNDMPYAESNKNPLEGLTYLQAIGRGLPDLYRIAYFGKTYAWHPGDSAYGNYHYSPILDMADKSKFESNYRLGKNLFCYSQILPKERKTPDQMMEVMQRDLKNFFGYDVVVETRQMPYLKLVATDKGKKELTTRGGVSKTSYSLVKVDYVNKPISSLIGILSYYLDLTLKDLPLIDETGIQGNIDIRFEAIMTDLDEVKRSLQKQGLSIVMGQKSMKVILIRE